MSSTRIPPLLEPFLLAHHKPSSLSLVTSVLGAGSNWLLLRYLLAYLKPPLLHAQASQVSESGEEEKVGAVVLVSFLRDGAFWRDSAGKLGLDLEHAAKAGRFIYVDGLTGLFTPEEAAPPSNGDASSSEGLSHGRVIRRPTLSAIKHEIEAALGSSSGKKALVIDGLDAVMAAAGGGGEMSSLGVQEMLFSLRERAHTTILTLSSDHPLLHAQSTSLEREHANLALSLAHAADTTLALRMLDTGTARDVSGVVRITENEGEAEGPGSREFLYHVQGDGGVRVFERGT